MAYKIKCGLIMYELIVCETPEDYWEMFQVNTGSCMFFSPKNVTYRTGSYHKHWQEARDKHKLHPASWYHYTKSSKGAYLRNIVTKVPVARVMLYQDAKGNWTEFHDLHYANHGVANQMMKAMANIGFTVQRQGSWTLAEEFRVPGFEIAGDMRCPYPYGDYVRWQFDIDYDAEKNEFVFTPSNNLAPDRYSHHGYIGSNEVIEFAAKRDQGKKKAA